MRPKQWLYNYVMMLRYIINTQATVDHYLNNCVCDYHAGSDKQAGNHVFKVKEKWLDTSIDFTEGVYYQGDLELLFYSMHPLDLSRSSRLSLMSCYIETEGYYAKLKNVKQIEIDE